MGFRPARPSPLTGGATTAGRTAGNGFTATRGALGMSLAMGLGRFFHTPVLPLMVAALQWGTAPGAWIATVNSAGSLFQGAGYINLSRRANQPT